MNKDLKPNLITFILLVIAVAGWVLVFQKSAELSLLKSQSTSHSIVEKKSEYTTYVNERFGYKIDYPKDWPIGRVADNNDGLNLFNKPNYEILAYGSNIPSKFSDIKAKRSSLLLHDGREATLMTLNNHGKVIYIVFFEEGGVQYSLYVNVPSDFYNQNKNSIETVAKSYRLIK